jgi:hypothetical protein
VAETFATGPDTEPWTLAALADQGAFDRHIDTVATAVADAFTLKVHTNIVARRFAYTTWIASLQRRDPGSVGYRDFVAACASLIASLARHRVVSYSAMIRDPADQMIDVVLKYPNEVTALSAGASIYAMRVSELTGEEAEPVSALVMENAAANVRRHPEAAAKFRELLQLETPWA